MSEGEVRSYDTFCFFLCKAMFLCTFGFAVCLLVVHCGLVLYFFSAVALVNTWGINDGIWLEVSRNMSRGEVSVSEFRSLGLACGLDMQSYCWILYCWVLRVSFGAAQ